MELLKLFVGLLSFEERKLCIRIDFLSLAFVLDVFSQSQWQIRFIDRLFP